MILRRLRVRRAREAYYLTAFLAAQLLTCRAAWCRYGPILFQILSETREDPALRALVEEFRTAANAGGARLR